MVVAAFVAACRAQVLSERTIEFYLEGLDAYRAFAGASERDLTLADIELDVARAWLADFVERGRKRATVTARARALRVFSRWIGDRLTHRQRQTIVASLASYAMSSAVMILTRYVLHLSAGNTRMAHASRIP